MHRTAGCVGQRHLKLQKNSVASRSLLVLPADADCKLEINIALGGGRCLELREQYNSWWNRGGGKRDGNMGLLIQIYVVSVTEFLSVSA